MQDAEGKPEAGRGKSRQGSGNGFDRRNHRKVAGVKAPPHRLRPTVQRKAANFGSQPAEPKAERPEVKQRTPQGGFGFLGVSRVRHAGG